MRYSHVSPGTGVVSSTHVTFVHLPPGIAWFFLGLSTLLALIYVGLPVLAVGTSVWWATFRARRDTPSWLARRARSGRLTGIGVGALAGVVMSWLGMAELAPAAVGVGYLSGVLIAELLAVRPPSGPLRVASLQPRSARRYLPRWAVPAVLTAGFLVIAGPVAMIAGNPVGEDWPSSSVLVPLALIGALALVLGGVALRRVELVPSAAEGGPDSDEGARRNTARAVVGAVLAIELLLLAALAIMISGAWPIPGSWITIWLALGLVVAAVLVWCVLGWWKRVPPSEPALVAAGPRPPEPPSFRASKIA